MKTYIEKFKKAEELDDYIFDVLLPTEVVSEVKGGKKSTKVRKLYPGYVFLQAKLYDEEGKLINKPAAEAFIQHRGHAYPADDLLAKLFAKEKS